MLMAARIETETNTGTSPGRPEAPPTTTGTPPKPGAFTPMPAQPAPQPGKPVTFPVGSITAYSKARRKWRVAVLLPVKQPVRAFPLAPMAPTTQAPTTAPTIKRGAFGYDYGVAYALGELSAPTHVQVAEMDTPPQGVQQVDESKYDASTGSAATTAPSTTTSTPSSAPGPRTTSAAPTAPGSGAVPIVSVAPAPFVPDAALPDLGPSAAQTEKPSFFRLNNPWMWAAIAGSVAVAGTGTYVVIRRKRGR